MQVVGVLKRLGYIDRPATGDHLSLFKKVVGHDEGPITIKTGVDCGYLSKGDLSRIRRDVHLRDDEMWQQAVDRKLSIDEYDTHLRGIPKRELVHRFWRDKF